MSIRRTAQWMIVLLLCGSISGLPSTTSSIIVGSAIEGLNASVANRAIRPGTTILDGDRLEVEDGTPLVGLEDGSRMTLGKNTVVSFRRAARELKGAKWGRLVSSTRLKTLSRVSK